MQDRLDVAPGCEGRDCEMGDGGGREGYPYAGDQSAFGLDTPPPLRLTRPTPASNPLRGSASTWKQATGSADWSRLEPRQVSTL